LNCKGKIQGEEIKMRIDLNQGPQQLNESNRNGAQNPVTSGSSSLGNALGEDQAQLSGSHVQVNALAAQASQLPEVRQERVQALRQAVQSGQYTASPEEVAGAMFADMISQFAA
jgi:flagellar biosynthesis anti-sigma factor FlgM